MRDDEMSQPAVTVEVFDYSDATAVCSSGG